MHINLWHTPQTAHMSVCFSYCVFYYISCSINVLLVLIMLTRFVVEKGICLLFVKFSTSSLMLSLHLAWTSFSQAVVAFQMSNSCTTYRLDYNENVVELSRGCVLTGLWQPRSVANLLIIPTRRVGCSLSVSLSFSLSCAPSLIHSLIHSLTPSQFFSLYRTESFT